MKATRWIICSAMWLTLAYGCRSGGDAGGVGGTGETGGGRTPMGRHTLRADIQLPPGLGKDLLALPAKQDRQRARFDLDQTLASLPRPRYLDTPSDQDERQDQEHEEPRPEPPLAAQKAYVQGRQAWRERNSAQAKMSLEAARRLAPTQPSILRLLGEVYTRTGNRVKGANYFRQAIELDPDDAHSLFILGRFAIEKGDFGQAVVLFNEASQAALHKDRPDPALRELACHFLGNALRSDGYLRAAVDQFNTYLQLAQQPAHTSRLARDRSLLRLRIGVTLQLLGDLHMRRDDPASALSAYDLAAKRGVTDIVKLDQRRVYAALRLGNSQRAQDLVIAQVQREQADARSLAMVRYLVDQGVPASGVARELEALYRSQAGSPQLAIATADVLPTGQAKAFLLSHLRAAPQDRKVFQALIRNYLLPDGAEPPSRQDLAQAIAVTAELMDKAPTRADEYGSILVIRSDDPQALLEQIDGQINADAEPGPIMLGVLRGLALAALGRFDDAQAQFQQVVQRSPGLSVARIELAKALIVQQRYEQAAKVLAPLSDSNQTGVILLRARVLAQAGKPQEAVALIDRVIREGGGDPRLIITKANLELVLGRAQDAEQTLLDALNARPTAEPLYEALLDLYDPPRGRAPLFGNQTARWRVLVKRLLGTIPNSRTGRLVQAQLYDAGRNYDQAVTLLQELLRENPADTKALSQILDAYHASHRTDQATALLEERLLASPKDSELLGIAMRFFNQSGDRERLFETQQSLLMLGPDTPARSIQLAFLYRQWGKHPQVVDVLETAWQKDDLDDPTTIISLLARSLAELGRLEEAEQRIGQAVKRFPEHEPKLNYLLAIILIGEGDQARGEQVMGDNVAKFPDHGPSNNGLGYAMVMRNERLDQALTMIQRAVEADPTSEAYMDSLGWVYYKLKRYEDAEVWLSKARTAALMRARQKVDVTATLGVISDHLGDTLYRLGREAQALRSWTESGRYAGSVSDEDRKEDPELESLTRRLGEKIKAVRAKSPVPVAAVPGDQTAEADAQPQPEGGEQNQQGQQDQQQDQAQDVGEDQTNPDPRTDRPLELQAEPRTEEQIAPPQLPADVPQH